MNYANKSRAADGGINTCNLPRLSSYKNKNTVAWNVINARVGAFAFQ